MSESIYAEAILPLQEEAHGEYLERARATMQALAADGHLVCSDDIWDLCPPPKDIDPRVLGGVFRQGKIWEKVDYVQSRRKQENHGRPIARWRLARA